MERQDLPVRPTSAFRSNVTYLRELPTCPKCSSRLTPGSTECSHCGVLVTRVLAQIEDPLEADYRHSFGTHLITLWRELITDYENQALHWKFVTECQRLGALEFAAYRYRRVYEVLHDDIAEAMLKQIAALALLELEEKSIEQGSRAKEQLYYPRALYLWAFFMCSFAMFLIRGGEPFELVSILGAILLVSLIATRLMLANAHRLRMPKREEVVDFFDVATGGEPRA